MDRLIDKKNTKDWINQFENTDRIIASHLINSLRLVSASKAELGLKTSIEKKILNLNDIALFPITKINSKRQGSEGRIVHMLEAIQNEYVSVKKILVSPTTNKMREEKIKHIILVDDIIGSGERLRKYWCSIDKTLKSWLSLKYCDLSIVTYAANNESIKFLKSRDPYLNKCNFIFSIALDSTSWDSSILDLCAKYGKKLYSQKSVLGYKSQPANIIFEWNAPNNIPAILWMRGPSWSPLFPQRSVPNELRSCFLNSNDTSSINILKSVGQKNLSDSLLRLIANTNSSSSSENIDLIVVLGLLSKGYRQSSLSGILTREINEIDTIVNKLLEMELLDENMKVNEFGIEILQRYRKRKIVKNNSIDVIDLYYQKYYPNSYKGFQRE